MLKKIFQQFVFLIQDLRRWRCSSVKAVFYTIFEFGVWAVVVYRLGRALFLIDIPLVRIILRLAAFLMHKLVAVLFGISVNPASDIGPGLYIGHSGMIIVHPAARIGRNLNIGPGVIIGEKGAGKKGVPVIKDNVYAGTGSKILGNITVGNDVRIGANAVVIKDVPDGATVVGVPGKIIKIYDKGQ